MERPPIYIFTVGFLLVLCQRVTAHYFTLDSLKQVAARAKTIPRQLVSLHSLRTIIHLYRRWILLHYVGQRNGRPSEQFKSTKCFGCFFRIVYQEYKLRLYWIVITVHKKGRSLNLALSLLYTKHINKAPRHGFSGAWHDKGIIAFQLGVACNFIWCWTVHPHKTCVL